MRYLVTGGAGFIGSAVIRHLIGKTGHEVCNLDKLTYAGTLTSLGDAAHDPRYRFVQGDICKRALVERLVEEFRPDRILHLAAESHVDRSIDSAADFIQTNLVGTYTLLEAALAHWRASGEPDDFRFQHISTDEVFGSLGPDGLFTETTRYRPNSPYSASKAAVIQLTRFLAVQLGPAGITANAIAPITTLTPRVAALRTKEDVERIASQVPLRRLATPEDSAQAMLFLASDAASYLNGVALDVNGGRVMM